MITRRGLLFGMLAAPAVIRTPGILMPVKKPVFAYGGEVYEVYGDYTIIYDAKLDMWHRIGGIALREQLENVILKIEPTDTPLLDAVIRANETHSDGQNDRFAWLVGPLEPIA